VRDLVESFSFVPNRRYYVLLCDSAGLVAFGPLLKSLQQHGSSFTLRCLGESGSVQDADIRAWLSRMKIGTYLYLAGEQPMLNQWIPWTTQVGFTEEERQIMRCGAPLSRLFCARCHQLMPVSHPSEVRCFQCGILLEVSDHYSRYHNAYYGYVILE
jgi:hypothetical protein